MVGKEAGSLWSYVADPAVKDYEGMISQHRAAMSGHEAVVRLLPRLRPEGWTQSTRASNKLCVSKGDDPSPSQPTDQSYTNGLLVTD